MERWNKACFIVLFLTIKKTRTRLESQVQEGRAQLGRGMQECVLFDPGLLDILRVLQSPSLGNEGVADSTKVREQEAKSRH